MLESINFSLQFISVNTPGGGGGGAAEASTQTGDFGCLLFLLTMIFVMAALAVAWFGAKAKIQRTSMSTVAAEFVSRKISKAKLAVIGAVLLAGLVALCGISASKALAAQSEDPTNAIKVYVDEATGQVTSADTATYTNQTGKDIAIADLTSAIAQEAAEVQGLELATMTVMSGDTVFYTGTIGSTYTPENNILVANGQSLTLSFAFKDLNANVALQLVGKTAIELSFNQYTYNTISYDANGATTGTAPASEIKLTGKTAYIAQNTGGLAKGDAAFTGWNTTAEGTGTSYSAGASYSEDADLTLYAQYQGASATITYTLVNEYKSLNHGKIQLKSGGDADVAVSETFTPKTEEPQGATALPNETDVDKDFGAWEFSHWSFTNASGEEVCLSESAFYVPTLEELGLTAWENVTLTAHFGKAVANFSINTRTMTFTFTEDETLIKNDWSYPVYKDSKVDTKDYTKTKLPAWYIYDGTQQCYFETAVFNKDFYHYKGIKSMDMWFGSVYAMASLYNVEPAINVKGRALRSVQGLENIDTSELESTVATFADEFINFPVSTLSWTPSAELTSIDLSSWVTPKLKDTSYMFAGCHGLNQVLLPTDQTSTEGSFGTTVERMTKMFMMCDSLQQLNISSTFGQVATTTDSMFETCTALKKIDAPDNFKFLSKCTYAEKMFLNCQALLKVDLSNLVINENTDYKTFDSMLMSCYRLRYVTVGKTWTNQNITLYQLGLVPTNPSAPNIWYSSDSEDEAALAAGNIPAAHMPISDKITYRTLCSKAIYDQSAKSLSFYFDHKVYDKVEFTLNDYLNYASNMKNQGLLPDLRYANSLPIFPEWYSYSATVNGNKVQTLQIFNESRSMIQSLDLQITLSIDAETVIFDPSFKNCTDLSSMAFFFMADSSGKQSFKTFQGWENVNTQNIRFYMCMFGGFSYKSIVENPYISAEQAIPYYGNDITVLDQQLHINAYKNDTYGTSFQTLDLSQLQLFSDPETNAEAKRLLKLDYMFSNCTKLTSVTLPSAPQNSEENILVAGGFSFNHAFENCYSLQSYPIPDRYCVGYAQYMLWNCSSITSLDLTKQSYVGNQETSDRAYNMLLGCNNLNSITIADNWTWDMSSCGLVETWHINADPSNSNPWIKENTSYHVFNIPYDQSGAKTNLGTFTRDATSTKGTAKVYAKSADDQQGTVTPNSIQISKEENIIVLSDGNLKVGSSIIKASPEDGYELSYWDLDGKKILSTPINGPLRAIAYDESYSFTLTAHFRKANYAAKAVYDSSNKTMTMYYDDQAHTSEGTVFDINPYTYIHSIGSLVPSKDIELREKASSTNSSNEVLAENVYKGSWEGNDFEISLPSWYEFSQDNELKRFRINCKVDAKEVIFDSSFADYDELQSISMWFMADSDNDQSFETFKSIDANGNEAAPFANLNTTSMESTEYAFGGLYLDKYFKKKAEQERISEKKLSDTLFGDPATNMQYNRAYNTYGNSIKKLDLSGFDFSKINRVDYMFSNCQGVESITFASDVNTSNLFSMEGFFNNCENCTSINGLDKFSTQDVDNMDYLFQGCSNLSKLDLSSFDTRNVQKTEILTDSLKETPRKQYKSNYMFVDCVRLEEIKITSNFSAEAGWTGWTLHMDMCGLPTNDYDDPNGAWKLDGQGESYLPHQIPLKATEYNEPTSQDQLLSGTLKRVLPDMYTVTIETADNSKGQIGNLNILRDSYDYTYINSVRISANQNVEVAAAAAKASTNEEQLVTPLYVDDRTYFAVPANGYKFDSWQAKWTDKQGTVHDQTITDQSSIYLTDEDKANVVVTANFVEAGSEAWALLSEDENGKGYFSFRYDKTQYNVGDMVNITLGGKTIANTKISKVYDVSATHNDNTNMPAWYKTQAVESYEQKDYHAMIPGFDSEFESFNITDGTQLTIVFEDSFKNFNTLQSLSCFFMQAPNVSMNYQSLVTPFSFDEAHFKGLNNICMDKVWNVAYMFGGHEYFNDINGSRSFTEINLSTLDMSKLNNMNAMFANCLDLQNIVFPSSFDGSNITSMYKTFFNCDNLYDDYLLNVLSQIKDVSNVTDMSYMFAKRHTLKEKRNAKNEEPNASLNYKFPASFQPTSVRNITRMFAGNSGCAGIKLVTQQTFEDLFKNVSYNESQPVDMTGLFEDCTDAESITSECWLGKLKVEKAVNMFARCYKLTSQSTEQLGSTGFSDFSTCTDMYGMFSGCISLEEFNPQFGPKFNTSKVKYMDCMFSGTSLQNFKFTNGDFDTSSVISFNSMFANCSELTSVDLGRDQLSKKLQICDARNMLAGCGQITYLTLKGFEFVSTETFNVYINTPIERNFNWDKDEDHSATSIAISVGEYDGTYPSPYGNMLKGVGSRLQSLTIDENWNALLSKPTDLHRTTDPFSSTIPKPAELAVTYSYTSKDLHQDLSAPLMWYLDADHHIIGDAGDIAVLSDDGTVGLPFGSKTYSRAYTLPNKFINFESYYKYVSFDSALHESYSMTADSYFDVNLVSPKPTGIGLPDNYKIKNIDLNNATQLEYWFDNLETEPGTVEGNRFKMNIQVTYNDESKYVFEIIPSFSRLFYDYLDLPTDWSNAWYMYNAHSDESPMPLVIKAGVHETLSLEDIYLDRDYLLTIRSNWQDQSKLEMLQDNVEQAVPADEAVAEEAIAEDASADQPADEAAADQAAEATTDQATEAQAAESQAAAEAVSPDEILDKASQVIEEITEVCAWILLFFIL